MIDRDRCPEGIEEAARWRSRRGIPQPLAGVLCGDEGCAEGFTFPEWWAFIRAFFERNGERFANLHPVEEAAEWMYWFSDLLDDDSWPSYYECDIEGCFIHEEDDLCKTQNRVTRHLWSLGPDAVIERREWEIELGWRSRVEDEFMRECYSKIRLEHGAVDPDFIIDRREYNPRRREATFIVTTKTTCADPRGSCDE